jgi:hypothetical protein
VEFLVELAMKAATAVHSRRSGYAPLLGTAFITSAAGAAPVLPVLRVALHCGGEPG